MTVYLCLISYQFFKGKINCHFIMATVGIYVGYLQGNKIILRLHCEQRLSIRCAISANGICCFWNCKQTNVSLQYPFSEMERDLKIWFSTVSVCFIYIWSTLFCWQSWFYFMKLSPSEVALLLCFLCACQ